MTWRRDHLPKIAAHLASRPGHNEVGADVSNILRYGFGAELGDIDHEVRVR